MLKTNRENSRNLWQHLVLAKKGPFYEERALPPTPSIQFFF